MRRNPWRSRKFLVGICSFIALLANEIFGIDIDPANLALVVLPIITWIIGESVIDALK